MKNIENLINIMISNDYLIQDNYNNREDLICIQEKLTTLLYKYIESLKDKTINKKELLKSVLKNGFELADSDIIIFKNKQIFIKLFDNSKITKVTDDEKNTIANRFNGIEEDTLSSFYNDFFSDNQHKDFFYLVAKQFVDVYLIEKEINNNTYENYAFSFIQSIVKEHLLDLIECNDDFITGFSGYLFRIHFKEVFEYIANIILKEISLSNTYMMEFLNYYSLSIVVLNGKKYTVPNIEANNGLRWNVASMISIVKIYIKTEINIVNMQDKINELKKEVKKLYIGGYSPLEYNSSINKKIKQISQTIEQNIKRLNKHIDSLDQLKDKKQRDTLAGDVRSMKYEIHNLIEEKEKLTFNIIEPNAIMQYTKIRREMDSLIRYEKREEKILDQNKNSYISIKNSLVKALTSKKTPIIEII